MRAWSTGLLTRAGQLVSIRSGAGLTILVVQFHDRIDDFVLQRANVSGGARELLINLSARIGYQVGTLNNRPS